MISVIIPIYNCEKYLVQCIDSVLAQTYTDWELILVNDGSTDNSETICLEYFHKYPNKIKYVFQKNKGVSSARNNGIENSNGEYICFIDADDYVEQDYLKALYDNLTKYVTDISICDIVSDINNYQDKVYHLKTRDSIIESILTTKYLTNNKACWNKLFIRNIIGDLRFNENIYLGEDTLFIIEYVKKCKCGVLSTTRLYNYTEPTSSKLYHNDKRFLTKYFSYIDSRDEMLKDISSLSSKSIILIYNSLLQSILESYFKAKQFGAKDIQLLCKTLIREKLYESKISLFNTSMPVTFGIMAYTPYLFDSWMYIHGKFNGLRERLKRI